LSGATQLRVSEGATLKHIADRLGITRPALYCHYPSKEAILVSIHAELALAVNSVIAWGVDQSPTAGTRNQILDRLAELLVGTWGSFMHLAEREEASMGTLDGTAEFVRCMDALADLLRPEDSIAGRMKARLALDALMMSSARSSQLGGPRSERHKTGVRLAKQLVR
jgi:AcrR family transcriptional regulator